MARTIASLQDLHRFVRLETDARTGGRSGVLSAQWVPLSEFVADPRAWGDLARRALEPNVFLEPAFALAAATHLSGGHVGVVSVQRGPQLLALLPGAVESWGAGRPVPTFVAWTHPFAPLSTPLVDRDAAAEAIAAVMDFLPNLPGAPKLASFPLLNTEGPVATLMRTNLGSRVHALDAHLRASFDPGRHVQVGSSGKRKELRRQRRRISELGSLTRETTTGPDVRNAVADYLSVEASGWKGRTGGAAQSNSATELFLAGAVTDLAAEGKAQVDLLKLDDRTIAAAIVLRSGDRAWFWKIAYDENFARFSPGVQLALDLTEALEADGKLSQVDSCAVAGHPMIDHLWRDQIAMADWLVQLDGRASFEIGIATEYARRAAIAPLKELRDRLRR